MNRIYIIPRQIYKVFVAGLLGVTLAVTPLAGIDQVYADTVPAGGTPATASADPLPTVQIDGNVWKTAIHGNTVYATGKFSTARPAGVPLGGAGTVTRSNILAFDITTGKLDTSFVHSLTGSNAEGRAISVSPDGKRVYVGGLFTTVDGQAHANFAAFDTTTNKVMSGFSGVDSRVYAIASTNSQVFLGGWFTHAGGGAHTRAASFSSNGAINASWHADVTGTVAAMVVAGSNLVLGGSFSQINGATYRSLGAVKLSNGANVSWASQSSSFPIQDQPPAGASANGTGITSLSTDGSQIYLTSFTYISGKRPNTFEGRAAINFTNGNLIWMNDCHGDSYDAVPIGQVLYSVSHAHDCAAVDGYADAQGYMQHALAETTYKTGVNGKNEGGSYPSYVGQPRGTILNWFPTLAIGKATGQSQAAWTITGNSQYIALGGEFPSVDGIAQQGFVRFAIKSKAPNVRGPAVYTGYRVWATKATSTGKSTVTMTTTSDEDNGTLLYSLYRDGGTKPIFAKLVDSRFWKTPTFTYTDIGLKSGSIHSYKLVASDPFGNRTTTYSLTDDTNSAVKYTGTWTSSQNGPYDQYQKGIHYTKVNGATASFSFTGSSISYVVTKNKDRGTAQITVDTQAPVTVNMNSATNAFQQVVFTRNNLGAGAHKITVKKMSGTYIDIDGFYTNPFASAASTYNLFDDKNNAHITYSGSGWVQNTGRDINFAGGLHYTKVNGQFATFTFKGTAVSYISQRNKDRGKVAVSVDGQAATTINLASTSDLSRQEVFTKTGLSASATHTITIKKVSGTYMDVDGFYVKP